MGLRAVQLFAQGYTADKDAVNPHPPDFKTSLLTNSEMANRCDFPGPLWQAGMVPWGCVEKDSDALTSSLGNSAITNCQWVCEDRRHVYFASIY